MKAPAAVIAGAVLAAQPSAAAGQALYFHSPREQQLTADLVSRLEAARVAHLAALDRHDAALAEAMKRERETIVRRGLTDRDMVLTRYLSDDAGGPAMLDRTVSVGLAELGLGDLAVPNAAAAKLLDVRVRRVRERRAEFDAVRAQFVRSVPLLATGPGVSTTCDERAPAGTPASDDVLAGICGEVRQAYAAMIRMIPCEPRPAARLLALAVGADQCWRIDRAVDLDLPPQAKAVVNQTARLRAALFDQRAAARLVTFELERLETFIACEQLRAQDGSRSRIASAAERIDEILADPVAWAKADHEASAHETSSLSCPAQDGSGSAATVPAEAETRQALAALLAASALVPGGRTVEAAVVEAAQEFRASRLGVIIQAAAQAGATPAEAAGSASPGASPTAADPRLTAIVGALVRSEVPLRTLGQVSAGTLPDTSGVLVSLAEAQMRASAARAEAARLERLVFLSERRSAALANRALLLTQARTSLRTGNGDRGLLLFCDSVAHGAIPDDVLVHEMNNAEYVAWSARERIAVTAGYAALAPAAAELKSYGESGIRADTIARFLNVAGLAAIAGTN